MSHIAINGPLMTGTGMQEFLKKVFGSVLRMITEKKYPQCVRALRLLVKELLGLILDDELINSHNMLQECLTKNSEKSNNHKTFG